MDQAQVSTGFAQFLDQDVQIPITWTRLTIPQQGPAYLKRPRLIDMMHNMIDRKLVLVRAPAGYGKTSVLVDLAYETDLRVCWYTLDEQSSDLGAFLTHMLASITRRFPAFGRRSLHLLQEMRGQIYSQLRVFVATVVDEILNTIPEYFFLVLDDYHTLDPSSNVHEFVRLFIDFMPEQCHLIIASRTVPPLPLIRLVARQQMAAVGVDELRFTEQEIIDLASAKLGVPLSQEQTHLLTQQTDGWITAILLSADTGWNRLLQQSDSSAIDLTETGIYDYLMTEVFASQPAEVQGFLLHTAILEEMTLLLCEELLGQECQAVLRSLERHNLFISRVEQVGLETAYRYHPLFHEFLVSRLDQDEQLCRDLHIRAADLFAGRQNWQVALRHNLQGERFAEAQEIILSHYNDLDTAGHRESLAQWIDALPPEYQTADLQVTRAALANELGQVDTALRLYANAIAHYESQENRLSLAYALIERSYALSRSGGYEEAIADCQAVLSLLVNEVDTDSLQGRAYRYLGMYYAEIGDPESALHFLSLAHQAWTRCGESPQQLARLAHTMGWAYEMLGHLDQALDQCQRELSIWESLGNDVGIADALNGIGVAHHRLGEYRSALDTLHRAQEKSQTTGSLRSEAYCLTSLADLYRDLGQFERALSHYGRAEESNHVIGEAFLKTYITQARAETLYLAGQFERAQAEVEQTLSRETLSKHYEARQRITLAATLLGQLDSQRARTEIETVLLDPSLQDEVTFRGHLGLAQAAMMDNQPQETEQHLRTAIEIAQQAGLTQTLAVESLNHIRVLEFVTEKGGDHQDLQKWIAAAKELAKIRKELAREQTSRPAEPSYPAVLIEALGGSRVLQDDQLVSWRTTQARELFFYLLTHPEGQTKEQIGATIWPDHSQAKLASIFRSSLFRLRKALFAEIVLFDGERYSLNPEIGLDYDVQSFEEAFSRAGAVDNPVQRAHHYRRAIDLYHGEFLADLYADWILHFREALQARHLQALTFLAEFNLDVQNYPQAIALARQLLSVDEHHETAFHVLIRSYAKSGQRPHARRIYNRYRSMLAEFDLEPEQSWEELCQ